MNLFRPLRSNNPYTTMAPYYDPSAYYDNYCTDCNDRDQVLNSMQQHIFYNNPGLRDWLEQPCYVRDCDNFDPYYGNGVGMGRIDPPMPIYPRVMHQGAGYANMGGMGMGMGMLNNFPSRPQFGGGLNRLSGGRGYDLGRMGGMGGAGGGGYRSYGMLGRGQGMGMSMGGSAWRRRLT